MAMPMGGTSRNHVTLGMVVVHSHSMFVLDHNLKKEACHTCSYAVSTIVLIREMIFVQPFYDNFLSHTHMLFVSSLFIFLSPLFLTNKKREMQSCHQGCLQIDVHISLLY